MILPRPIYSGLLYAAAPAAMLYLYKRSRKQPQYLEHCPSDSERLIIRRALKAEPEFGYMQFLSERPAPRFLWSSRFLNAGRTPKFFIRT